MNDFQAKYLAEVSHRLCNVNMYGGMSYDADFVQRNRLEDRAYTPVGISAATSVGKGIFCSKQRKCNR